MTIEQQALDLVKENEAFIEVPANKQDEPLRSALLNHKIRAYNEY